MINEPQLRVLIEHLEDEASREERLLLLEALTHLPVSAPAWRSASSFANDLLGEMLDSGTVEARWLEIFARVPLLSLRSRLRELCHQESDPHLSLACAIALCEQHDPAGLPRLIRKLHEDADERTTHAIACAPSEALRRYGSEMAPLWQDAEPMVQLWLAIALAKAHDRVAMTGSLEPLRQLWDALVHAPRPSGSDESHYDEVPPLFWGDPMVAVNTLATTRPVPHDVQRLLLDLKERDFDGWTARSSRTGDARHAKVLIAGLTGLFDVDGERVRTAPQEPTAADRERQIAAERVLEHLRDEPWQGVELNASAEERAQLHAAPQALAAEVLETALEKLPERARQPGVSTPWTLGNAIVGLASALPAQIPLRITRIIRNSELIKLLPVATLSWVLARAGATAVWKALVSKIVAGDEEPRALWLTWLRDIAQQLEAPAPYAGAGGESATSSEERKLIDDLPRVSFRGPSVTLAERSVRRPAAPGAGGARAPRPPAVPPAASVDTSRLPLDTPPQPAKTGPEDSQARYLQGNLYRKHEAQWIESPDVLVLDWEYRLDVLIGPAGLGTFQSNAAFPDHELPWRDSEPIALQVVLAVLDGRDEAQVGELKLPRRGVSSICTFEFKPQRLGPLRIRLTIHHGNRILQTATIEATVVATLSRVPERAPAARSQTEMIVHENLDAIVDRRPFDASLLLNHTADGSATATANGGGGAYIASLDASLANLETISCLLQDIARNSRAHTERLRSKVNSAWLSQLAREGHFVYRNLVLDYIDHSPAAERLRNARYLQIVTARPDAVVPLEFVYEYGFPDQDARLCNEAEKALAAGRCPETCSRKKRPERFVCPLGFWGLSRVIERHVHDPTLPTPAFVKADENTPDRKQLILQGPSLLAASKQVPKARVTALGKKLQSFWRSGVTVVNNWSDWLAAVKRKPVLFVVLPHASGSGSNISLEINGDTLESARIERPYVYPPDATGSPPIVLLLGCNTAGVADTKTYARHITVFRQARSAIVLATTAAVVWGEDIAKVAEDVLEELQRAALGKEACFGDILREAKCRAVRRSQLVAVCLAAIGDADWRIAIPNERTGEAANE